MNLPFSVDLIFNLNNIILIGWITLIFFPHSKWKNLATFAPAAIMAGFYTYILICALFFAGPDFPPLDFFSVDGWMKLLTEPYMVVGVTNHFVVLDLWLGRWMVENFYPNYRVSESTFGSLYFKAILLVTYMVAPLGFLIYFASVALYFRHYPISDHAVEPRPDTKVEEVLDKRPVRFGEDLPEGFQEAYYFLNGLLGIAMLLVTLVLYLLFIPFAFLFYLLFGNRTTGKATGNPKMSPRFLRTATAQMRLKLALVRPSRRGLLWTISHRLLQFACFTEYIANAKAPEELFGALRDTFGDFFPFGDGIGVANRDDVIRILQDPEIRKGPLSLGWTVSTSQFTFSKLTTIFLSSSGATAEEVKIGRKMAHVWMKGFPHNIYNLDSDAASLLNRILPDHNGKEPEEEEIYKAVGNTMFFIATDGQMKQDEREAYVDTVKNPMIFFPNWFNFLLGGHALERKGLNSYYKIREAFSRYMDGPALRNVFQVAYENDVPRAEALRLIAVIFSIAGAAAPAKVAASVIKKLYEDPGHMVPLYKKSPINFILEVARIDKAVPMVNVLAREEMTVNIGGKQVVVPENTPLHCSLMTANRDPKVFGGPEESDSYAEAFDPERGNLGDVFSWNGLEKLITDSDHSKRPPRYCPGHDFSIGVIKYLADRYMPILHQD